MTLTRPRLAAATVDLPLTYACQVCDRPLEAVEFTNGRGWSVRSLAMRGRRRFKSVLCFDHYVAAYRAALKERSR
jgi:hypothetical protein